MQLLHENLFLTYNPQDTFEYTVDMFTLSGGSKLWRVKRGMEKYHHLYHLSLLNPPKSLTLVCFSQANRACTRKQKGNVMRVSTQIARSLAA